MYCFYTCEFDIDIRLRQIGQIRVINNQLETQTG